MNDFVARRCAEIEQRLLNTSDYRLSPSEKLLKQSIILQRIQELESQFD